MFLRGKPSPLRFDLERAANLTDYDAREQFPQCDSIRRVGPVLAQMWQGWAQSWRRCGEQRYRRGELARRIDGGAERGLVPCDARKYALQRAEGRRAAM